MSGQIMADFHLHTGFSADSEASMESMVQQGIQTGLSVLCFTEHLDRDYPEEIGMDFSLDMDAYHKTFCALKDKYDNKIELRFGVELGLQPHLGDWHRDFVQNYSFDFIIGSTHIVDGMDPYYPYFYENRTEEAAYLSYFESTLENLNDFTEMDVYGHIDYVVRYGPNKNTFYSYDRYREVLDEILLTIIRNNLGIECNTGGIKYGLGHPNPCEEVLSRYRELGGEIITIGSDAHEPRHMAYAFETMPELLKSCGFRYYTVFKDRTPEFIKL